MGLVIETPLAHLGDTSAAGPRTFAERRRARNMGITYLVLAVITAVFLTGHDGTAMFKLDDGRSFSLPAQTTAWVAVAMFSVLAGGALWRGYGKLTNAVLALVTVTLLMTFLSWSAAGTSFSLIGVLVSTVGYPTPIVIGAMSGIICERSGIVNIAIEGLLLNGAFMAVFIGSVTTFWIGVLAAMVTSALLAWLLAWLAIRFKVDQVIVGFFINFFVLGLTNFLSKRLFVEHQNWNYVGTLRPLKIWGLHSIPVIGPILFEQTVYVYVAWLLVFGLTWLLFRTRWGLRTRSVGEHPRAADTLGINVVRLRYRNVIIAGAIAGFGGSWFASNVGQFNQNMTGGRGFIALAVVIVGRWKPIGALCAALVFGLFDSLGNKLATLHTGIPSEFISMLPYLATVVVVCGFVGRSRGPKAAGQPYDSQ
ncbi:MAG: transporter permease [Ilumatobacteraceae bacterium]|nr:transporter permease [Ilumatobacteraceae bacterium]